MPMLPPVHRPLGSLSESERKAAVDARRGSRQERGYGARWERERARFLRDNPLCVEHERNGRVAEATVVDHVKPHRGDQSLFWTRANWQSLCKPCHDSKTAREDGGFGNRSQHGVTSQ